MTLSVSQRSLGSFCVTNSGPTGHARSKVRIHVVSSPPLLIQVLVAALKEIPVNWAKDKTVAFDASRLDRLQVLLQRVEIHPMAAGITLHVLSPEGVHTQFTHCPPSGVVLHVTRSRTTQPSVLFLDTVTNLRLLLCGECGGLLPVILAHPLASILSL
jgi:hypothetical protein